MEEILRFLESLRMTGVVGIGREETCHSKEAERPKNLGDGRRKRSGLRGESEGSICES